MKLTLGEHTMARDSDTSPAEQKRTNGPFAAWLNKELKSRSLPKAHLVTLLYNLTLEKTPTLKSPAGMQELQDKLHEGIRRNVDRWLKGTTPDYSSMVLICFALDLFPSILKECFDLAYRAPVARNLTDQPWVVSKREDTETLMHKLIDLYYKNEKKIVEEHEVRKISGLLSGAAISLYDAVLHAHDQSKQSDKENLTASISLMEEILNGNRIHAIERQSDIYLFGWYMNNAKYRLQRILSDENKVRSLQMQNAELLFERLSRSIHDYESLTDAWGQYFEILEQIFHALEAKLS
jgi:hypothetical protein